MYLTDTDGRPQGWAAAERNVGSRRQRAQGHRLQDRQGEVVASAGDGSGRQHWAARWVFSAPRAACCSATTAANNFVAYDASSGKPLWHAGLGATTSNGPQTFLLDGRQYIVVGAGDTLYAFALQP